MLKCDQFFFGINLNYQKAWFCCIILIFLHSRMEKARFHLVCVEIIITLLAS
jgi:hypothetical protein